VGEDKGGTEGSGEGGGGVGGGSYSRPQANTSVMGVWESLIRLATCRAGGPGRPANPQGLLCRGGAGEGFFQREN
jgi:hypothetical protein